MYGLKGLRMSNTTTKTLSKRHTTKHTGVLFKEIQQTTIDDKGKIKTKIIDKVYMVRYRDGNKEYLVTLGKYSTGIREAYCKTKRDEFIHIAKNGELPPQLEKRTKKNISTLNDLADVYFDSKDDSQSKSKQQGKYNLHIKPSLGSQDIHALSRSDFKILQKVLKEKGKAPKTVNGILALAKAIINYSIKEEALKATNPVANIKPLKEDDKRDRFLSIEEIQKLLKAAANDTDLYNFVQMALATGARLESVLNIKKKDIDLKHDKITIKDFKNDSTYTAFFNDDGHKQEVSSAITRLKINDKFINVSSRTIQRKLKPILDKLFNVGLDIRDTKNRAVPHTLRHTFASQLAIAGVPILTIKNLMNHGNIEMTMRYAKLAPDSGLKAVRGLYNG